ncbi:MAG: Hsp20/alpha crystallin family protein [Candidatus Muiribacteriota bacterium]
MKNLIKNKRGFHTLLEPFMNMLDREYGSKANWQPPVDIFETPDLFCIITELPGISKDSIKLYLEGKKLVIAGEKKECIDRNKLSGKIKFYRIERSLGSFKREIVLPGNVEVGNMKIEYNHGVLEIYLSKAQKTIIKVE